MQLRFANNSSSTVWIAIMFYDPNGCGEDGNWGTAGWWHAAPGQEVHTNIYTSNRYFCFYAEGENGEVWSGPYGPIYCNNEAFNSCVNIASTADIYALGVQEVDAGWWHWAYNHFTMHLV